MTRTLKVVETDGALHPDPDSLVDGWLAAYAQGDRSAFPRVLDVLGPRVYRTMLRLCRDASQAEDLVQITFLKVHRAREQFRPGDRAQPWVFAIAMNAWRDELRRTRREPLFADDDGEVLGQVEAAPPFLTRQGLSVVEEALSALPLDQRSVVLLHKVEGLPMDQVAQALGISNGAARVRAHRGYKAIALYMEAHGS
jgi:RNA polymerase sigma-70 factor (ECF subfamily)